MKSLTRFLFGAGSALALVLSAQAIGRSDVPLLTPDQKQTDELALTLLADPGVTAARETGLKKWSALPAGALQDGSKSLEGAIDEAVYSALRSVAAGDPANPKVVWVSAPPYSYGTVKVPGSRYAGDSPDRIYRTIAVDPSHRYEVYGRRRTSPSNNDFSFEAIANAVGRPVAAITAKDIDIAADGSFSITLDSSTGEGKRNHLTLPPGTRQVLLRDTLADWSTQLPNELTIKRLDSGPTSPRTQAELRQQAAREVAGALEANIGFLQLGSKTPVNQPEAQIRKPEDGVAGNIIASSRFSVGSDEALIVTIDPGGARYVGFQLTDPWLRSRPYWKTTGSLSNRQVKPNADGSLTYVIAAHDPGYYNWLDTGGLHDGLLLVRVENFDQTPDIAKVVRQAKLVKLTELASALPAEAVRVTPAERAKQLAGRYAGYEKRVAY